MQTPSPPYHTPIPLPLTRPPQIYETQKLLEAESQLLRRELSEARISLTAWQAKLKVVQEALKEAGDLEHYIEYLGREAALIARVSTELGICSPRGSEGGLLPPPPASADAAAPAAAAAAGAGAAAVLGTEGLAAAGRLGEVPSGGGEGGVAGQQEGEQGGAAGGSGEGGLPVSGSLPLSCGASR